MPHRNDPCKQLSQAFTDGDTTKICQMLKKYHHCVDIRDESHGLQTPLMRVCHLRVDQTEREEILQLISRCHPDANMRDGAGRTALCHACISEKTEVVLFLSQLADCDPNIADDDGNTPLIYATKSRKSSIVETLLSCFKDRDLDVNHRNERGVCALKEAENRCDSEICRLLVNVGADTSVLDKVQFPRDPRNVGTPRTPTPDHIAGRSPQLSRKRNRNHPKDGSKPETVLSPLVAPPRPKQDHSLPNFYHPELRDGERGVFPRDNERVIGYQRLSVEALNASTYMEAEDNDRASLPDVDEADETEDLFEDWTDEGFADTPRYTRRRKNSLSMPDLRENGSVVATSSTPSSSASGFDDGFYSNPKSDKRSLSLIQDDLPLEKVSEQEEYDYKSCPSGKSRLVQRRPSGSLPDLRESRCLVNQNGATPSYGKATPRGQGGKREVLPTRFSDDSSDSEEFNDGGARNTARHESNERLVQSYAGSSLKLPQLNIHAQLTSSLPHLPKPTRTGFAGNRRPSITSLLNSTEDKRRAMALRRESTEVQLELRGSKVQSS